MNRAKAYIESSVVSYYVARASRDVVVLAHQEITRGWWKDCLPQYEPCISEVVLEEVRRGDPEAAAGRINAISAFTLLPITAGVEALAAVYVRDLQFPEKALRDALHIALASAHAVDYLVTWNCAHIASAHIRRGLAEINTREGVSVPVICTPEELMYDEASPS
jgi:hypothetical protein